MYVESLLSTEDYVDVRVVLTDLVYDLECGILGDAEASGTYSIQSDIVGVWSPEQVEVNVYYILSSYGVGSVGFEFRPHPLGHQIVEN